MIRTLNRLCKLTDEDITRYLRRMVGLRNQGLVYFSKMIRNPANSTHENLQTVKFKIACIFVSQLRLKKR